MIRYCPAPSVTADRVFSMSAGLDASTVTPGSTAPEASFTVPVSVAWANTVAGSSRRTRIARPFVRLRIHRLSVVCCGQAVRPAYRQGEEYRPAALASRVYKGFCCCPARKSKDLYTEVRKRVRALAGNVYKRAAGDPAERVAVRKCLIEHAPGQECMLPRQRLGARALALGNGLEDRAVVLLRDGQRFIRVGKNR